MGDPWGSSPPRWLLDQGREVRKSGHISAGLCFFLEVLLPPYTKAKAISRCLLLGSSHKTHRRLGRRTFLVNVLLPNALHGFL